jgi:hypothetical protein
VVERNTDRQDAPAWVREGFVIPGGGSVSTWFGGWSDAKIYSQR